MFEYLNSTLHSNTSHMSQAEFVLLGATRVKKIRPINRLKSIKIIHL